MHTEPHTGEVKHHKPKHLAEKFEGMIGVIMVAAIVLLAVGFIPDPALCDRRGRAPCDQALAAAGSGHGAAWKVRR